VARLGVSSTVPSFPPSPLISRGGGARATHEVARGAHWGGCRITSTDGSRTTDPVTVGAAFWNGSTSAAGLYKLPSETSIFLAENVAIHQALEFAYGQRLQDVVLLTDSLSVFRALQSLPSAHMAFSGVEPRYHDVDMCSISF